MEESRGELSGADREGGPAWRRRGPRGHERPWWTRAGGGLWKLTSRVFPENRPSLNLMAWSDFDETGVHKSHGKLDGV